VPVSYRDPAHEGRQVRRFGRGQAPQRQQPHRSTGLHHWCRPPAGPSGCANAGPSRGRGRRRASLGRRPVHRRSSVPRPRSASPGHGSRSRSTPLADSFGHCLRPPDRICCPYCPVRNAGVAITRTSWADRYLWRNAARPSTLTGPLLPTADMGSRHRSGQVGPRKWLRRLGRCAFGSSGCGCWPLF
jgi:hypothetical protein